MAAVAWLCSVPRNHVAGKEVLTLRIPVFSVTGSGGARCGSIREPKKL